MSTREPGGHEPRAARKALMLLEAVARLGSGATARDISQLTGIPAATAYRLLNVLVADGYLLRIADLSGFALGRRTRELADAVPDQRDPQHAARAAVAELRGRVRIGIFVASYDEDGVRFVDRDPDHELAGEGAIAVHLHASAVGKLLLAHRPELASTPVPVTDRTIVDPEGIARELADVRGSDVARELDELRIGRSALAVPVRRGPVVVGCVAAIGRTGRLRTDDPELTARLRSCAEQLTLCAAAPGPWLPGGTPRVGT